MEYGSKPRKKDRRNGGRAENERWLAAQSHFQRGQQARKKREEPVREQTIECRLGGTVGGEVVHKGGWEAGGVEKKMQC